jgi:hypothetical protein
MKKVIVGAAIGDCIHVAGIFNFLKLAEEAGFKPLFLGPAVAMDDLVAQITAEKPELVALSYRLSGQSCARALEELKGKIEAEPKLQGVKYVFGGTTTTARVAKEAGIFEKVFDGNESREEIIAFLQAKLHKRGSITVTYPDSLLERMAFKKPLPLIRHHFGQPSLQKTVSGAKELAKAGVLDVISLGPDQTAQEFFFKQAEAKKKSVGAGGVPLRKKEDLVRIYEASRCGNYPLLRCYSGTDDVLKWAEMLRETIKNAWCAVPLFWYNVLDRRSRRGLTQSIKDAQKLMRWHAQRNIPVEVNEAHQWSLRQAPDSVAVATAFLAAYNAKQMGVKHYVAQYMLNTPGPISAPIDLAKMLAKIELIEDLHDQDFRSYRQVRPGLLSYPVDLAAAKGQLAFSTVLGMMLKPDIVHVVAYCEAQYAATPSEIIKSCKIANRIIQDYMDGFPDDLLNDERIQHRKDELKKEARTLLKVIEGLREGQKEPLTSPEVLTKAVMTGLLDAPDLKGNPVAKGEITTDIVDGACVTIDPKTGRVLPEKERIKRVLAALYRRKHYAQRES